MLDKRLRLYGNSTIYVVNQLQEEYIRMVDNSIHFATLCKVYRLWYLDQNQKNIDLLLKLIKKDIEIGEKS